jgi:hypothetical protein
MIIAQAVNEMAGDDRKSFSHPEVQFAQAEI